jgi:hypothetical protein
VISLRSRDFEGADREGAEPCHDVQALLGPARARWLAVHDAAHRPAAFEAAAAQPMAPLPTEWW